MSKLRVALVAACLLVLGLVICPQSPRIDADRLLRNVLRARHSLSYEAVQKHTSVFYGKEIHSTIEISHEGAKSSDDHRLELLILRNYIPVVEGIDRIAGRDTWVLRLKPKVKHRPWKQLWVDRKTCAIMASRDWTALNTLKRSMKTTSIHFVRLPHVPAVSGNGFPETTERHGREFTSTRAPSERRLLRAPMVDVPTGFELMGFESARSGRSSSWIYSDGLYSISVYVNRPGTRGNIHNKPLDWGQGLIYTTRRSGREIAVVADLPPDEIARIARSISH